MRFLLAFTMAAGLFAAAAPAAQAEDPWPDWPWVCVKYPCYPEDYPPFVIETVGETLESVVDVHWPVVCVTEPCP